MIWNKKETMKKLSAQANVLREKMLCTKWTQLAQDLQLVTIVRYSSGKRCNNYVLEVKVVLKFLNYFDKSQLTVVVKAVLETS